MGTVVITTSILMEIPTGFNAFSAKYISIKHLTARVFKAQGCVLCVMRGVSFYLEILVKHGSIYFFEFLFRFKHFSVNRFF
jgi:hypothetical protein